MDNSQQTCEQKEKSERQKKIVDEFLLTIDESNDWVETYKSLDDVLRVKIHFRILSKFVVSIEKNDIGRFKELDKMMTRMDKVKPFKTQIMCPNFIIIACKCNRLEILKELLNKEMKALNNSSTVTEREMVYKKIFHPDIAGHTACYYAIRSNNIDLLETLLESVTLDSSIWYENLSKDYESLRMKNVCIHESMEIFVEERLLRELFFRDIGFKTDAPKSGVKKAADTSQPEVYIYEILTTIITAGKLLNDIVSHSHIESTRVHVALFVARKIRILKRQLKSTYSEIPWEEMEFCLSRYSFLSIAERKKLHLYFDKFIAKLTSVFGINDEHSKNDNDVLEEIRKYVNGNVPVNRKKVHGFEDLYDDYELIKDEYSLKKILRYIQLALWVNPEEHTGMLIIQRALLVIGEYVKNSPASPNLSDNAQETFTTNRIGPCIEIVPSLRNTLSHIEELHVLFLRKSIESQKGFFTKIQEDLKRIISVIVHAFCFVKAKRFKKLCTDIIRENDANEIEELCIGFVTYLSQSELPNVEAPENDVLNRAENFLTQIRNIIHANRMDFIESNIENLIAEIEKIISSEKKVISERIININENFQLAKQLIIPYLQYQRLNKSGNNNSDEIIAETKRCVKHIILSIDVPLYREGIPRFIEIAKLIDRIHENVEILDRYPNIVTLFSDIKMEFVKKYLITFRAIEEFKEKLDISEMASSVQDDDAEKELNDAFGAFKNVLESEETFQQLESSLEKKREIHRIKLKVIDDYEKNKHHLTLRELDTVKEKMLDKRSEGIKLLEKTPDYYAEFLAGKRDFQKFAGSFRLKGNEVSSRLIEIFNKIKSQHDDYTSEFVLNESIRQIEDELTKEQYENLFDKFKNIKHDHEARIKLISFFNCDTEFKKVEYEELVGALNTTPKAKVDLKKLYKFLNIDAVVKSLDDTYGSLVCVVKNKESTAEKMSTAYVNFLDSLGLQSETTKLLKRTIMKNKIFAILDELFSNKLNGLKELLGNVGTRESKCTLISRYRSDEKLQATSEMLLFDLCNVSMISDALYFKFMPTGNEIPLKFLEKGFLYLNGTLTFLTDNSLRNYLAHGDALIDASLCFDPSIAIISSGILFSEEGRSLIALRDFVNDEKIAKSIIDQFNNIPDQLVSDNFPLDSQFNVESFKTLKKSNYWKYYLKRMSINRIVMIDSSRPYEQHLNDYFSQATLFTVTMVGDKQKLVSLFELGEEIHSRDHRMRSLLHVAANEGHNDIVEFLLNKEINVDVIDDDKRTSMHLAALNGHYHVVKTLLNYGAKVDAQDAFEWTPLHNAALLEDCDDVARTLLKHGANCNTKNSRGSTPLHIAACSGNFNVIKLLVEDYKAIVNVEDNEGNKILHMAAKGLHDNVQVFEYLFNKSCDSINCENRTKETPLSLAASNGNCNVIEAIMKNRGNSGGYNDFTLLKVAVETGDPKIVQTALKYGGNVNSVLSEGNTALHIACLTGCSSLVEFLINENAKVDIKNFHGSIPLHIATRIGIYDTVKILIELGKSDVNTPTNDGSTSLHLAVFFNHLNIVKYLVEKKADFHALDNNDKSLLHYWQLNEHNDVKIADYLIDELNVDVNARDKNGYTALAYTIDNGSLSATKYLVKKGTLLDIRDNEGRTVLHLTVLRGNLDLLKYFIEKMIDYIDDIFNAADLNGDNILQLAVVRNFKNIVNVLLETRNNEAFINSSNKLQITPLYWAIRCDYVSVAEILLEHGADANAKSNQRSLIATAIMNGSKNIVKILLKKGADPNGRIADGNLNTPLIFAVSAESLEIVEILLDEGADINLGNNEGITALHNAANIGNYEIVKVLVNRSADVEAVDRNGWTPLKHAIQKNHQVIIQLLATKIKVNS